MKVEGLSTNGTICPTSQDYGYIVFLLRDCKAEEGRHLFYDEEVLHDFIKSNIVRRRLVNGIQVDAPRNSDDTVATWRDGDIPQINALTKSGRMNDSSKQFVQYMKQSASRSKDEQGADKSPMFKTMHKLNLSYTSKDKPTGQVQMLVEAQLQRDDKVNLKADNKKALLDFIGQIGEIMICSASPRSIKKGFLCNGMIDGETETCPDIDRMLGTLTRPITQQENDLLEMNFGKLFKI